MGMRRKMTMTKKIIMMTRHCTTITVDYLQSLLFTRKSVICDDLVEQEEEEEEEYCDEEDDDDDCSGSSSSEYSSDEESSDNEDNEEEDEWDWNDDEIMRGTSPPQQCTATMPSQVKCV